MMGFQIKNASSAISVIVYCLFVLHVIIWGTHQYLKWTQTDRFPTITTANATNMNANV